MIVTGQAAEALTLTNEMTAVASHAGLEVGRAVLLVWHGYARLMMGDTDGVDDMRGAAETLAENADTFTPVAYANLANTLVGLGEMREADRAYGVAGRWAERMSNRAHIDWIDTERAFQNYHAGAWDEAERLVANVDPSDQFNHMEVAGVLAASRSPAATNRELSHTPMPSATSRSVPATRSSCS